MGLTTLSVRMRSLVVTPEEALSGESKVRRENARLKKDLAVAEQRLDELVAELNERT